MRICPQQVCILYVYMHTYKLTVLRVELTVWTVSSAAHLTPFVQLRVTARHRRQTQSHKLFKTVNQHLYNVIILQIITGEKFKKKMYFICTLTSSDNWALFAQDDDLGAHCLSCLLDCQVAFFIHVDNRDSGVHTSTSNHRGNNSSSYHCCKHKKQMKLT